MLSGSGEEIAGTRGRENERERRAATTASALHTILRTQQYEPVAGNANLNRCVC